MKSPSNRRLPTMQTEIENDCYEEPGREPVSPLDHNLDRECAKRLIKLHGARFRYLPDEKVWMVLCDGVWRPDRTTSQMSLLAEDVADQLQAEATAEVDGTRKSALKKLAKDASTAGGQKRMIARARLDSGLAVGRTDFDQNPWLISCRNGVVDLRKGHLREHRPGDYCTRQVPVAYDPCAQSDEWDSFLETAQPDPETRAFVQRAAGYSLTGTTDEEAFFVLHGPTSTGKSTFLGALRCALGEYAAMASLDTFLARARGGQIRNDVARLDGVRFVAASECNADDSLDAGQIKAMTGGDIVVARFLRQELFEFEPQCKIWMATNHRPLVSAADDAVWRRILEVPFTSQVEAEARSGAVKNNLRDVGSVGPAILKWAVDGCLDWQQRGLDPPEEIQAATLAYRAQMAVLPKPVNGHGGPNTPPASLPAPSSTSNSGDGQRTRRGPWEFRLSITGAFGRINAK
jgi:putative DNA primase/helicase